MVNWGQGFQGAAGGAMAGGAFGGPLGAVIGGGLGFAGGLFGGGGEQAKYQEQLQKLATGYGNRTAPQAGPASTAGNSGFRGNQAGLIAQLEAMGRGEGPSAAQMQMREAMDRAAGSQASAAAGAGGRGVNAGGALRNAMNNTAAIQQQGARDTATMRAQEQFNALGQLGQVTAQGRAADEQVGMFNAGQQNNMSQFNAQQQMQMLGLNDASQLKALFGAMGMEQPGMGSQILAGGANAVPGLLQWNQQRKMAAGQPQMKQPTPPGATMGGIWNGYGAG
jgi:hypothetical protein